MINTYRAKKVYIYINQKKTMFMGYFTFFHYHFFFHDNSTFHDISQVYCQSSNNYNIFSCATQLLRANPSLNKTKSLNFVLVSHVHFSILSFLSGSEIEEPYVRNMIRIYHFRHGTLKFKFSKSSTGHLLHKWSQTEHTWKLYDSIPTLAYDRDRLRFLKSGESLRRR